MESTRPVFARRIMGIETEYGLSTATPKSQRALSPDEVARVLFRPIVEKYASSNIFATNASRLYLDVGSHPEVATAECDSLSQLIAHECAGDRVMNRLALQAEEALTEEGNERAVYLLKITSIPLGTPLAATKITSLAGTWCSKTWA